MFYDLCSDVKKLWERKGSNALPDTCAMKEAESTVMVFAILHKLPKYRTTSVLKVSNHFAVFSIDSFEVWNIRSLPSGSTLSAASLSSPFISPQQTATDNATWGRSIMEQRKSSRASECRSRTKTASFDHQQERAEEVP